VFNRNKSTRRPLRTGVQARAQRLQDAEHALVRRELLLFVASAASLVLQRPATANENAEQAAGSASADPLGNVAEEAVVVPDAGVAVAEVAGSAANTGSKQVCN